MHFGTYYNWRTKQGFGLRTDPDKLFALKHGVEDSFTGFKSFAEAAESRRPEERIFQLEGDKWCEIMDASVSLRGA